MKSIKRKTKPSIFTEIIIILFQTAITILIIDFLFYGGLFK